MSDTDLIILVIFLICITYVVRRAIEDLDDQTKFEFDKSALDTQLEELTLEGTQLKDIVEVSFGFKPDDRFKFSAQPRSLSTTIKNKSKNVYIYADWDKSTLTDYETPSRRVIRLNSDKQITSLNLPIGGQVVSPITPGKSLTSQLAAEDVIDKNAEKGVLEPMKPLVDIEKLDERANDKKKKPSEKLKEMNTKFRNRKAPLEFTLRLMLRMNQINEEGRGSSTEYQYPLQCKFRIQNMHWWDQIPWNPKK